MPQPIVVATRKLPPQAWNELTAQAHVRCWEADYPVTREWLLEHIPEANGLYCLLTDRIDQEVLQVGSQLRVISTMSVGYDHIDIPACTSRNIPVGHTPGILTETTADFGVCIIDGLGSSNCGRRAVCATGAMDGMEAESLAGTRYFRCDVGYCGIWSNRSSYGPSSTGISHEGAGRAISKTEA